MITNDKLKHMRVNMIKAYSKALISHDKRSQMECETWQLDL